MTDIAFYLLVFLVVGSVFLFFHLMLGKLIRPSKPDAEKLTIYECGEPTVGSAWIQFDLRYYVVALLFVVFDVEVAFFFPWAVVFGTAAKVDSVSDPTELISTLQPQGIPAVGASADGKLTAMGAKGWAWMALTDIGVFFAVLMVGFAYLWRRGDIDWIRSVTAEPPGKPAELAVQR